MRRPNRPLAAVALLLAAGSAAADGGWSSLWRTPDQRGEQLLDQGKAAEAAHTYADPRRKAFAELQAGQYADAARDFSAFDDAEAQYNRGNALARGGQLPEALKAYDAALQKKPGDRDAQHNRELVSKALEQQQQQKQDSKQNSKQDESKNPQNSQDAKNQQGQSDQQARNDSHSSKDQQNPQNGQKPDDAKPQDGQSDASKPPQDHPGSPGAESKPSTADDKKPQDPAGKSAEPQQAQAGKDAAPPEASPKSAGPAPQQKPDAASQPASAKPSTDKPPGSASESASSKQDADSEAQARRDVQAGLPQSEAKPEAPPRGKAGSDALVPPTEQQMAQEQWLRQIPDDPGGLLRRKFMIEHLMRQQQKQEAP